jgi:hypothetical protein
MKEIEDLTLELRNELYQKIKFSKYILEIRVKEKNLVKIKNYAEAEKAK